MIVNGKKYENRQKLVFPQNSKTWKHPFQETWKKCFQYAFLEKQMSCRKLWNYISYTLLMFQIAILTLSLEAAFFTISSPWNGMTVRAADSSVSLYNWFLLSALCHIMPSHIKKWNCNITKAICHQTRMLPHFLIFFPNGHKCQCSAKTRGNILHWVETEVGQLWLKVINRRTELVQKCRHMRKFTFAGFKSRKWDYECSGNWTGTEIRWEI